MPFGIEKWIKLPPTKMLLSGLALVILYLIKQNRDLVRRHDNRVDRNDSTNLIEIRQCQQDLKEARAQIRISDSLRVEDAKEHTRQLNDLWKDVADIKRSSKQIERKVKSIEK